MALINVPRCRWGSCLYGQTGVRKAAGNRVHYFTTPHNDRPQRCYAGQRTQLDLRINNGVVNVYSSLANVGSTHNVRLYIEHVAAH